MPSTLVVTGCDVHHFPLAADLLASLTDAGREGFDVGFVHVGDEELPADIANRIDRLAQLRGDTFHQTYAEGLRLSYLAVKARLPELFPGYDLYVWLDGDTWVQNRVGLDQVIHCARLADFSAHPETDPNYHRFTVVSERLAKFYPALFGESETSWQVRMPQFNSGVFGARASSPLWRLWGAELERTRAIVDATPGLYHTDQAPLHHLIVTSKLNPYPLRAVNNWLVHAALPAVDFKRKRLTAPTFPNEEINILHLTWVTKDRVYRMGDGDRTISFRYRAIKALFAEA